jgi:hypothetical protein
VIARGRLIAVAAALTAGALVGAGGTAEAAKKGHPTVKRPKVGQYIGQTRQKNELTLVVAGKRVRTIRTAVAEFKCGYARERLTVHRLKLRRTRRGYTFALHGRRSVTFNDRRPPQRAAVDFTGRFTRAGKKARGRVRVKSPRCGGSGKVRWSARHLAHPVKAPKSGEYDGQTGQQRDITLVTSGSVIQLASIQFRCSDTVNGVTNLNYVAMKRTAKGYAFSIKAHGSVTYSDGRPDENAEVDLSGRFSRTGRTARGHIRVKSPRCGGTGPVPFSVKRAKSG